MKRLALSVAHNQDYKIFAQSFSSLPKKKKKKALRRVKPMAITMNMEITLRMKKLALSVAHNQVYKMFA